MKRSEDFIGGEFYDFFLWNVTPYGLIVISVSVQPASSAILDYTASHTLIQQFSDTLVCMPNTTRVYISTLSQHLFVV